MFAAYFINKSEDIGINFEERKIIDNEEYEIINDYLYLGFPILYDDESEHSHYLYKNNLDKFFLLYCVPIIEKSDNWKVIKEIQDDNHLRFKFVELPEQQPFYFWMISDPETKVKVRGTYGSIFCMAENCFIFDMWISLVRKK